MNSFLLSVVAFLFAIGLLVAVHEWGHYIVARMAGVKVLRFSIGFGKAVWTRRSGPDDTEYCLAAIPLGGYVHLLDERRDEVPPAEVHRTFNRQPIMARIAILVAGPAMNFLFAILAYWVMFVSGAPGLQPVVGDVEPGGIAAEAGFEYQDRIIAVGNEPVATWEGTILGLLDEMLSGQIVPVTVRREDGEELELQLDIGEQLHELTQPGALFPGLGLRRWSPQIDSVINEVVPGESAAKAGILHGDQILRADGVDVSSWIVFVEYIGAHPGETIELRLLRDGREIAVTVSVAAVDAGDGSQFGRVGLGPKIPEGLYDDYKAEQRYGPARAVIVALERTWSMSVLTGRMVGRMFTGDVSIKNISGPINIAAYAGYSASIGLAPFLSFLAVVSLSLGILNLLPVPVLDGGQIIVQLTEAIKGSPLSDRVLLLGQQIGMVLLMLVMSIAFYNDITRFFS
jgi:regulator of sigma E protease